MKNIIIVTVILVAVAGAIYFVIFTGNNNQPTVTSDQVPTGAAVIKIKDFAFSPSEVKVKKGTKITWINNDSAPHTITSDSGAPLDSATIFTGQSFVFVINDVGNYDYHCKIHPTMKSRIIVEE